MKLKLIMASTFVAALCAQNVAVAKEKHVSFSPDTTTVLHNPLTGWVMYLGRNWDENFWTTQHYDAMPTSEQTTVRVSDYASTAYIRTSWAAMEPKEGVYFWNDKSSRLFRLLQSVRQRGLRLAFRIVVDSRDQGQNTPLYVRDAGANGFADPNNPQIWSPYPDDPVFQEKYAKFIRAFAQYYDNADEVDFIDGFGLGKWGEAHGLKYADYKNKEKVYKWIISLYTQSFKRVPLLINYHRLVADTISWEKPNPASSRLLDYAVQRGYSLRHDAFGMTGYYQKWEKDYAKRYFFKRPIVMEGGWITGGHHRYWIDPSGRYRQGHSEDVRNGEMQDALEAHVNMMDLRVGDETASWFGKTFPLVKQFAIFGGYRLYPSKVVFNDSVKRNQTIRINAIWNNLGDGYCPTNIPQWQDKYKIGYALINQRGEIVQTWTDRKSDLSTWLKGKPVNNQFDLKLPNSLHGTYTLVTSLVDTTKNNLPALQAALPETTLFKQWIVLGTVNIL